MGLGLPIYGSLLGLTCAVYCFFTGQLGLLAAIGLYSSIGVVSVFLGAILIVLKPDENAAPPSASASFPLASHR